MNRHRRSRNGARNFRSRVERYRCQLFIAARRNCCHYRPLVSRPGVQFARTFPRVFPLSFQVLSPLCVYKFYFAAVRGNRRGGFAPVARPGNFENAARETRLTEKLERCCKLWAVRAKNLSAFRDSSSLSPFSLLSRFSSICLRLTPFFSFVPKAQ